MNLCFYFCFFPEIFFSEIYGKVVVASKDPLPNYRPDLDDKRPQREVKFWFWFIKGRLITISCWLLDIWDKLRRHLQVVIPLSLQRRVESLLQEHLDRMLLKSDTNNDSFEQANSSDENDRNGDKKADMFLDGSVMEKVLQRQSLRMRNMQRSWQVLSAAWSFLNLVYYYYDHNALGLQIGNWHCFL